MEKTLHRNVIALLRKHGGAFEKIHQSQYQRIGISDVLGCFRGGFVAIETKSKGKKPTAAQLRYQEEVRAADGWAAVVYDLEPIQSLIMWFPSCCKTCFALLGSCDHA